MVADRCSRCHRYKKNAPTADVCHVGSKGESQCKLNHFPAPCDFLDDDGAACDYTEGEENFHDQDEVIEKNKLEDKLTEQAVKMDQLQNDMAEMKRLLMATRLPQSLEAWLSQPLPRAAQPPPSRSPLLFPP